MQSKAFYYQSAIYDGNRTYNSIPTSTGDQGLLVYSVTYINDYKTSSLSKVSKAHHHSLISKNMLISWFEWVTLILYTRHTKLKIRPVSVLTKMESKW